MKTIEVAVVFFLACTFQNVYSASKPSGRIVGGDPAYAGQFSFAAAIYVQTATGTHFCGGSLINNQWILTAAHCVDGATQFVIYLGSNNLSGTDPNRVTVASSHYVIHPEYDSLTLANDIALIELRLPIQFTNYVQPIELAKNDVTTYAHLTAIGWGQVSDDIPELSDHLQYVSLITITNEECANTYGYQISSDMVCAAGNYIEGTCLGDTGSALVEHIYNPQGIRHAGVSSFISGDGCDQPHPSGYTRTFVFLDWIANVTGTN